MADIFRIDRPTNKITLGTVDTIINPLGTFYKNSTLAAGLNVLRVTGLQTDDTALTGILRGAYIDVSNGSLDATGTIRGMELKARTEAPGDTGNDVAVLEGLSISADSKGHGVTTMRGAEFILDGSIGGTITEAVGLRIANNFQADKATVSYGLQIYRDSFDYTADIQLSSGGLIGGLTGALQIASGGNVGIGTLNPATNLEIVMAGATKLRVTNSDNSLSGELVAGIGVGATIGFWLQTRTNHPLHFSTNNGEAQITLEVNGKVGINVIDPHSMLEVNGAISSATLIFSTEGPTDDLDVSSVNTLFLDCSANDVTIGGFAGGVDGQVLYIARTCAGAFSAILEHAEPEGTQKIYLHAGALDEELDTEYGGWVLICNGTSWFDTSHSKHV